MLQNFLITFPDTAHLPRKMPMPTFSLHVTDRQDRHETHELPQKNFTAVSKFPLRLNINSEGEKEHKYLRLKGTSISFS